MAKTTAPLFGFDAAGSLGKSIVFSRWRGRSYVRRHQVPANPQSSEQTVTRSLFSWLNGVYKIAPSQVLDVWQAAAQGKALTDRNAWIKANLPFLRSETDLNNIVISGGARGGIPPISITVTPGNDQLTIACAEPTTLPDGWTITKAVLAAIEDQNPQVDADYKITAVDDLATPFSQVVALKNATLYQCAAWLVYTRPDGSLAYSASVQATGLTT